MSLTNKQKEQIRYMVSCNPSIENMGRTALLSDEDVVAELAEFISVKIPQLQEDLQYSQDNIGYAESRIVDISSKINLLSE